MQSNDTLLESLPATQPNPHNTSTGKVAICLIKGGIKDFSGLPFAVGFTVTSSPNARRVGNKGNQNTRGAHVSRQFSRMGYRLITHKKKYFRRSVCAL